MPAVPHSIEELVELVLSLQKRLAEAEARADAAEERVAQLERENAELRARLGKDSSNSHEPPSSDSPYKARPPRKKGERKAGGQHGHKGHARAWLPPAEVDEKRAVRVATCTCGTSLDGVVATTGTWSRQVVEIPAIKPSVIEYAFEVLRCPCCARLNVPPVPPEAATSTGPVLSALAATLVGKYHLSRDAAADLLSSVLGLPVCAATVQSCCAQASEALAAAAAAVAASLPSAASVHMDETSWKQGGVLKWLWIAVSEHATAYAINARRGAQQLEAWFPGGFAGVVTSDRWRPYERFDRRQLCWSHLLRDLQAIVDGGRAGAATASTALDGATAMFATWHRFKRGEITRAALQDETRAYRAQVHRFCAAGARQQRDKRWRALGRDLLRQWEAVFLFLDTEGVEPTNNVAERGLRSSVLWRRASQGTRTDAGSDFVERVLTTVENCRRQGRRVLDFIAASLLAWRSGLPTPGLLPS